MRRALAGLCVLAAVDHAFGYAVVVFGPEVAKGVGVGVGTVAAVGLLRVVGYVQAAPRVAAIRPVAAAGAGGLVAATSLLVAGVGPGVLSLAVALFLYGTASAAGPVAHQAVLAGWDERPRFIHRAAGRLGNVAVPLGLGALAAATGAHWRATFVVAGVVSLGMATVAFRLVLPGAANGGAREQKSVEPSPALVALTVASVCELPLYICAFAFLAHDLGLGVGGRVLTAAGLELVGVLANVVAVIAIRRRRLDLARTPSAAAASIWVGMAAIGAAAWIGSGGIVMALLVVGALAGAALIPLLLAVTMAAAGPAGDGVRRTAVITLVVAAPVLVALGPRLSLVLLTLPGGIGALLAQRSGSLPGTGARTDRAERALLVRRPLT